MPLYLQNALVLTLAALAVAWLVRRSWRTFAAAKDDKACGCGGDDCAIKAELQRKLQQNGHGPRGWRRLFARK